MRLKTLFLASTGALALLTAAPAQAEGFYIAVGGGVNFSQDENGTFFSGKNNNINAQGIGDSNAHFDVENGFLLTGAIGFGLDHWLHGLSIDGEVGYRRNDIGGRWDMTNNIIVIGDSSVGAQATTSGEITANLSTFSLLANLWYEFDIGMRFKPYFGGGVGWARSELDGTFVENRGRLAAAAVDPFDTWHVENSGFAYQLGFGIRAQVMPGTSLGVGYVFFNGPNLNLDINDGPFIDLGGPSALANSDGHFKFDNDSHTVAVTLGIAVD